MFYEHNFETDTKLFQIRFNNIYWGEVWASDSKDALAKANLLHANFPKKNFKVVFVANLYPITVLSISDVCTVLDEHNISYYNPVNDEHQLILKGTNDILEGGYSLEDESWDFFIRSTSKTSARSLTFKTSEQLISILRTYYAH